tara:strand:- start:132 stop:416 length:285 start_codon:yes stop_codon:yes gene_type:complete
MDRSEQLSNKIKTMDLQLKAIASELSTDKTTRENLIIEKNNLIEKINEISLRIRKNEAIQYELNEIIDETRLSYQKISEAADTLMDIIDAKYKI